MNEKMMEIIEKTPSIAQTVLKSVDKKEDLIAVVKGLLNAKDYKIELEEEREIKMLMKEGRVVKSKVELTIDAIKRIIKAKDLREKLSMYHAYFDVLIEDIQRVDSEVKKWKKSKKTNMTVEDFLKEYFSYLKEFKVEVEEYKIGNYDDFVIQIEKNIKMIQQIFSSNVSKVVIGDFVEFERQIQNEQKTEVALVKAKELPPMSKLKKDDLMVMMKEINLYKYEDALKIMEVYIKKYKQDIRFSTELVRMQFKAGKEKLKTDQTALEIKRLLNRGDVHPQYPYFPYQEKTEEEFFEALKKDLQNFHEDDLSNLTMEMNIERVAKANGYNFELSKERKEKFEKVKETFLKAVEENLALKPEWFRKNGKYDWDAKTKQIIVEFEGKEYAIENIFRVIDGANKEYNGSWGKVKELFFYQGYVIEQRNIDAEEEINVERVALMYEVYLLDLKKKNPIAYEEKIKEIASWYPADRGTDPTTRTPLNREIYIDILIEFIKNKEMTMELAKFLVGETFLKYTEHYTEVRKAIRAEDDEFHEMMVDKMLKLIGDEYKEYTLDEIVYILRKKTSLNKKGVYLFVKELKPNEIKELEEVLLILEQDDELDLKIETFIERLVGMLMT